MSLTFEGASLDRWHESCPLGIGRFQFALRTEEDRVQWPRVKLFPKQTIVCVKCGSECKDGDGNGSGPLCARCEAVRTEESPYVWIGRALVRRSEVPLVVVDGKSTE